MARGWIVVAVVVTLSGCAEAQRPPHHPAWSARYHFVGDPVVEFAASKYSPIFRVTARVDRALPQAGHGVQAELGVTGGEGDIPGLQRSEGVRRCYEQDLFLRGSREPADGEHVTVTLAIRGRHPETVRTTVSVIRRTPTELASNDRHTGVLRRLGCPPAPREQHCDAVAHGGFMNGISVTSGGGGATCATARLVMARVARWADSRRCFDDLCVREHRINAGFRCTVAKVGEADWTITCRRGRQVVRGFTAE